MIVNTSIVDQVLNLAIAIQQIPAPPFDEGRRAEFVHRKFLDEGLLEVNKDSLGNVFARLPGEGKMPPLVVTAHLDTVFPETTDLSTIQKGDKIFGPGIGDNALGVAGLFGLLWSLQYQKAKSYGKEENKSTLPKMPGDLWLVANVGEEGLGNLRGMRAVVDRFGKNPLAYLVLEGMALGQIYHRALGVQRFRITIDTAGGHSWVNFGDPSAVNELAVLITQLNKIPAHNQPRSTLNVGVIKGGTSVNSIASNAFLELDLRSEDRSTLTNLANQVTTLIEKAAKPEVQISLEEIGHRPAGELPSPHQLILIATRRFKEHGIQPNLTIGSTDANIPLSLGLPSICFGLSTGSGAHTLNEYINTKPLAKGLSAFERIVSDIYAGQI